MARAPGEPRAVPAGGVAQASAPRRLLEAWLNLRGFLRRSGCDLGGRRLGATPTKNAVAPHRSTASPPPAKGILGPWVHKYPHFAVPQPAIGFLQEALRWWDRWLKDKSTPRSKAEPRLRVYVMDLVRPRRWYEDRPGRWIGLDGWREPGEGGLTLAAGPGGTLGPQAGDLGAGIAVASPQDCGLAGGEYCAIWLGPEMPGDERPDDERSAVFDTAPISAALDIVGTPVLSLRLSADRPQAMVAARLCEVHSNGASTRISYAVFNLGHRFGHDTVLPVVPGEIMEVELRLDDVAYRAAAGNRLRLALSSAYWPLVWPSPQTVTLTLHSAELALPTVGDQTTDIGFADPEGARPWQIEIVRQSAHRRKIEPDQTNGTVRLDILDDFGEVRDLGSLASGSVARAKAGPSIRPIPCRRAARHTGRKPCRAANGRSAQRPSAGCGAMPGTSTLRGACWPMRAIPRFLSGISTS